MIKRTYEETDDIGKHKVLEQKNGIKVRILREPSKAYADKMKVRADAEAVRRAEDDIQAAIRKKISDRQRQLAIDDLLSSGNLTQEEVDKIGG